MSPVALEPFASMLSFTTFHSVFPRIRQGWHRVADSIVAGREGFFSFVLTSYKNLRSEELYKRREWPFKYVKDA